MTGKRRKRHSPNVADSSGAPQLTQEPLPEEKPHERQRRCCAFALAMERDAR